MRLRCGRDIQCTEGPPHHGAWLKTWPFSESTTGITEGSSSVGRGAAVPATEGVTQSESHIGGDAHLKTVVRATQRNLQESVQAQLEEEKRNGANVETDLRPQAAQTSPDSHTGGQEAGSRGKQAPSLESRSGSRNARRRSREERRSRKKNKNFN